VATSANRPLADRRHAVSPKFTLDVPTPGIAAAFWHGRRDPPG
jgi:hypothetical protein